MLGMVRGMACAKPCGRTQLGLWKNLQRAVHAEHWKEDAVRDEVGAVGRSRSFGA